jgi:catechol 2,3-dioxygenase
MGIGAERVGHVVLRVRDLSKSLPFYCDGLGFTHVTTRDFGEGNFAFLTLGHGNHHDLGLLEVGPDASAPDKRGVGMYHVQLKVGDDLAQLRAAKAACEAAGINVHDPMDHTVCQSIYVTDPDGNEIEISVDADPKIWRDDPAAVSGAAPLVL